MSILERYREHASNCGWCRGWGCPQCAHSFDKEERRREGIEEDSEEDSVLEDFTPEDSSEKVKEEGSKESDQGD